MRKKAIRLICAAIAAALFFSLPLIPAIAGSGTSLYALNNKSVGDAPFFADVQPELLQVIAEPLVRVEYR